MLAPHPKQPKCAPRKYVMLHLNFPVKERAEGTHIFSWGGGVWGRVPNGQCLATKSLVHVLVSASNRCELPGMGGACLRSRSPWVLRRISSFGESEWLGALSTKVCFRRSSALRDKTQQKKKEEELKGSNTRAKSFQNTPLPRDLKLMLLLLAECFFACLHERTSLKDSLGNHFGVLEPMQLSCNSTACPRDGNR